MVQRSSSILPRSSSPDYSGNMDCVESYYLLGPITLSTSFGRIALLEGWTDKRELSGIKEIIKETFMNVQTEP